MQDQPPFTQVSELAKRLNKHITVYDLEATTFRGQPNFGITEVACFVVPPTGPGVAFGSLINPEREISREAGQLTGITRPMVQSQETWGAKYADLFSKIAAGQCYAVGFNNSTFDNPAVAEMNARYGKPFEKFTLTFDVRRLHLRLSASKSQAGNLPTIAAAYGVKPRGSLHRAAADVALTLELLNAIVELYGLDAVVDQILAKPLGARAQLNTSAVAKYVRGKKFVDVQTAAAAFKKDPKSVSFEIGKGLDERLLPVEAFRVLAVTSWMAEVFQDLQETTFSSGKLKPVYDALAAFEPPPGFDYIQLRIGLLDQGRTWASLKPVNEP
jgi:DNA polymerase III epsilon subunit-like protein